MEKLRQVKLLSIWVALMIALVSCAPPLIFVSEFRPNTICSGEKATFHWVTNGISRVSLTDKKGTPLFNVEGAQHTSHGSITLEVKEGMLPLKCRAYNAQMRSAVDVDLFIVEKPVWTKSYFSIREDHTATDFEKIGGNDLMPRPWSEVCGPDERWGGEYTVYRTYTGFTWQIPGSDFSDNIRVVAIRNDANQEMNFIGPGGLNVTLAAGATHSFSEGVRPGDTWRAVYSKPQRRVIGTANKCCYSPRSSRKKRGAKPPGSKPCNFFLHKVEPEHSAQITFLVACEEDKR